MFRAVVAYAFVATAFGFAPRMGATRGSSAIMMAEKSKSVPFLPVPAKTVGLVGSKEFDPIGFTDSLDVRWLQEAEIKHGRIAMLAWAGFVVTDLGVNPVLGVSSVEAHNAAVASGAGVQVLAFIAALEFISVVAMKQMFEGSGRQPGDFGFDPAGFSKKADYSAKEIENGRAAMLGFAGVVTQSVATGHGFPYF